MEENKFMNTLLQDIMMSMDEDVVDFYYKMHDASHPEFKCPFETAIANIVTAYFSEALNPDELARLYKKNRDYKLKKKKRWADNISQCANLEYDDKKYPFKELVHEKVELSDDEWKEKYQGRAFDEVIEEQLNEVEKWRASKKSKMIEFPMLLSLKAKAIYNAFEMDVFFEAYKEIKSIFDNAKNSYLKSYLQEMGEGPYFSPSRRRYNFDNATGIIPMSEDGTSKLVMEINQEFLGDKSLKMLDSKDLEILSYLLDVNPEKQMNNEPILVETRELAKIVSGNSRPSSLHYEEAENRCYQMANITFNKFIEGRQVGAINWLDSAIHKDIDGKRYMDIVLGSRLVNSIIAKKISRLPAPAYEKLCSEAAKILYVPLQKRRIVTCQRFERGEINSLKATFTYNDFLSMMNFGTARKAKNYNTVCEAFQEYVDKKEVIEHYDTNRTSYTIDVYFYSLSDEERRNMENFNII